MKTYSSMRKNESAKKKGIIHGIKIEEEKRKDNR
jgi:hypothetical protein